MKNLNETVHGKILIQAEEAKQLGFNKLAERALGALSPMARDPQESITYSAAELQNDIQKNLWKVAVDLINYYDLQSVDIQRVDEAIQNLTHKVAAELERAIDYTSKIGPLEPKLPGESK